MSTASLTALLHGLMLRDIPTPADTTPPPNNDTGTAMINPFATPTPAPTAPVTSRVCALTRVHADVQVESYNATGKACERMDTWMMDMERLMVMCCDICDVMSYPRPC